MTDEKTRQAAFKIIWCSDVLSGGAGSSARGYLKAVWLYFWASLELVCGDALLWKLMRGAGPADLGGVPGIGFG